MQINKSLEKIYQPYLENLKNIAKQDPGSFSYPLFMKAFTDYEEMPKKILFVGKETYGWIGPFKEKKGLTVKQIMDDYEEFEFGKAYQGKNSPFWRFIRNFHTEINGSKYPNGFLWTNFSKCDAGGTTPDKELQDLNFDGFKLIIEEIIIVNPDIIIFLTGWGYEEQFQKVFKGLIYTDLLVDYAYKCKHTLLPANTYMTMHPNGLNFRGKFNEVMNLIVTDCKKSNK